MPYKDPERRRAASRDANRRARAREAQERSARVIAGVAAGAHLRLPDPPGRDELLRLLGVQARGGSVRAIELLLKRQAADAMDVRSDPFASFTGDELAGRRVAPRSAPSGG